jgi:hypothetical protein
MALTTKQLKDVCLLWSGTTQCRYLDEDDDGKGNVVSICKKLSPLKTTIDEEVDLFLVDMKKNSQDPTKQGVPLGDNCQGYVVFKSKAQGYDVKP